GDRRRERRERGQAQRRRAGQEDEHGCPDGAALPRREGAGPEGGRRRAVADEVTSFAELVDSGFAEVLQTRRHLHACPELSFEERETSAVIRERMRGLGADELPCPTASGGVFVIDGGTPGHTVLLRADIDGLP